MCLFLAKYGHICVCSRRERQPISTANRPWVGHEFTRNSRFKPVLLLIALRVSDDREAASVVDDEESPFVTAGEGDDAFRLH